MYRPKQIYSKTFDYNYCLIYMNSRILITFQKDRQTGLVCIFVAKERIPKFTLRVSVWRITHLVPVERNGMHEMRNNNNSIWTTKKCNKQLWIIQYDNGFIPGIKSFIYQIYKVTEGFIYLNFSNRAILKINWLCFGILNYISIRCFVFIVSCYRCPAHTLNLKITYGGIVGSKF